VERAILGRALVAIEPQGLDDPCAAWQVADRAARPRRFLDVPIAEAEAKVQPDAMADDLRREPMTLVGIGDGWYGHAASMPHGAGAVRARRFPRK